MKAEDVILQLAKELPNYTNLFSDNFSATIVSSSLTATVTTTEPHGLKVGSGVVITGAETPIAITSLTRSGTVATAICGASPPEIANHDMTFGQFPIPEEVLIADALEPNFNGLHKLLSVPNRQTFTFEVEDTGSPVEAGNPNLLNGFSQFQNYNGVFEVLSVTSPTTFTYAINQELPDPTGDIVVSTQTRVSGAVDAETAELSYTKQATNKFWCFVVLGDVVASKNRSELSDATSNEQRQQQGDAFRQQIISTVSLYVFIPTSSQIAAREGRDTAQDLFRPICQSILNHKFNSGLFNDFYNSLQFNSHNFFTYTSAYYVHQYNFEQMDDLQFEDSVGYSPDVAFRDISLSQQPSIGAEQLTAAIDLDDDPL